MKKLLTILFAISTLIFVACEDKDDKDAAPDDKTPAVEVCDPACNADTETCVCKDTDAGDHTCACEAKATDECKCDDGSACPDSGKDACPKHEDAKCDPACDEAKEDCLCEADKCECRAKDAPADDPCKNKEAGADCAEGKVCTAAEDGKLVCMDKPAPAPACNPACDAEKQDCVCEADKCECKDKNAAEPEDPCKDKAENADCGENKTCQKGEGDNKLECKDKPADPAPTQPDKPE